MRQSRHTYLTSHIILHNFLLALGHNACLPPAVAAWAANGLFGGVGMYLAVRLQ
jgi:lipopolysaccharide export LptBFGC system permease protein LptF